MDGLIFLSGVLVGTLVSMGVLLFFGYYFSKRKSRKIRILALMLAHGKKIEVPYTELTPEYIQWWRKRSERLVELAVRVRDGKL